MKVKSLGTLVASVLGVGALVLTGALIIGNGDLSTLGIARATPTSQGSYVISASDFSDGAGNINVGGDTWHFEKASKSGDVVSIGGVFYTSTRSGASKADGRRGDGYTRLVFSGLDQSHAVGLVLYEKGLDEPVKNTITTITSDMDLTVGSTIASANRRGLQFAQAEGEGKYFSFSTMTVYYGCADVAPSVDIENNEVQIGVGENANLTTSKSDVFDGDTVSYAWESDDADVATVVGNGANAVVTGVAAGSANVTVTMTVNGTDYLDSIEVTITAAAADIIEVELGTGSYIQGNMVFTYFDTTSTGKTAAEITAFGISDSSVTGINNTIESNEVQGVAGNTFRIYSPMHNGAVGLTDQFTLTYDFRDSPNNKIYRAVAHYDGGYIASPVVLSAAAFSVEEGKTLEVTAAKGFYLEGTPSEFAFASLDTNIFTVTSEGSVATITGVAQGSASLRVTMTLGGKNYVIEKTIAVTEAGVKHLITWYTEGTGNQRNHIEGAGIWTWVNYGALGFNDFNAFNAKAKSFSASFEHDPAVNVTGVSVSDDIAASKVCRVYVNFTPAYNDGTLTLNVVDSNDVTYTGNIVFVNAEATAYNSGL